MSVFRKIKKTLSILGPGLVTGASDDDPSGIATYSQAGAQYGMATLWTALITFPLMAAIQEMCARIGLITSVGLTTTLKKHYPRPILYLMMLFSVPAIILNIGADIAGMAAVSHLMFPSIHTFVLSLIISVILVIVIVYLPYTKMVMVLKYLCLSLLLYILVPFFTHPNWWSVLKHTFIPTIHMDRDFIGMLVAILGTTISPYLFFWQVTMEAEDVKSVKKLVFVNKKLLRKNHIAEPELVKRERRFFSLLIRKMEVDVNFGMFLSNLVMFFIILATGTALFANGINHINTVEEAATALEPVAGKASYLLFTVGVLGTGFLAFPVLSGSLSYIVSETFGWKGDLNKKFFQAKAFYIVIIASIVVGLLINYTGISPIKALVYTAILYGITSPVLIAIVMHVGNSTKIMGEYKNGRLSNILGVLTLILMTVAAIALFYFQFS